MKDRIIADWHAVELSTRDGQDKFKGAVQAFLDKPSPIATWHRSHSHTNSDAGPVIARVEEYTSPSDMPSSAESAVAAFHAVDDIDTGYERVFDMIDFTQSTRNGFDIFTTGSGLTFSPVLPGEKAEVHKIAGEKVNVTFDRYGGALQWDKTWFDDAEYWNIEDTTREFRNTWFSNRAQVFYDLISASRADSDVAWQGDAGDDKFVRDAETINEACSQILVDMQNAGMDVNPQTRFVVVAPVQKMARLQNALRTTETQADVAVNFVVDLAVTTKVKSQDLSSSETSQYFVCLPGRKAKGGIRQELTLLAETDVLAYAETVAGWGRYGGVVGDVNQFRRCAMA